MVIILDKKLKKQIDRAVKREMKNYWKDYWNSLEGKNEFELFFHDLIKLSGGDI